MLKEQFVILDIGTKEKQIKKVTGNFVIGYKILRGVEFIKMKIYTVLYLMILYLNHIGTQFTEKIKVSKNLV